jgi:hypothetical protein
MSFPDNDDMSPSSTFSMDDDENGSVKMENKDLTDSDGKQWS